MFGLVWKGHIFDKTSKYNMQPVAIKIISFDKVTASKAMAETRNEIYIMS